MLMLILCLSVTTTTTTTTPTPGWSNTSSLNYVRAFHTAFILAYGKVFVTSGYNGGFLNSAELYDPSTGIWATTDSMNYTRGRHTAFILPNGKVLVAGGQGSGTVCLKSSELYQP